MKRVAYLLLAFSLAGALCAQSVPTETPPVQFRVLDVYVDSHGTPLGAYQIDVAVTNVPAKIVGIEGGDHPAFSDPPYYDPKAMQHERVIIGAFSTNSTDQLPAGRTRVATIHLQTSITNALQCELKLMAAGDNTGARISADAAVEERKLK